MTYKNYSISAHLNSWLFPSVFKSKYYVTKMLKLNQLAVATRPLNPLKGRFKSECDI